MKHLFTRISVTAVIIIAFTVVFVGEAISTEWNVSLWGKRRVFTEHVEKLAELVSQKTDGKFTLKISYGGLSKNKENLDGISIGAFEMAQFCAGYHRDKNPTITVLELPFLGVANLREEVAIANAVYAHPAAQADLARWNAKAIMTTPLPQYNLVGTGEPLTTLASMKGMRVRATGGVGKAFKAIGAVPTSVTATEAYNAIESGVVDTVAFAQHAHLAFRTIDIADWWTENLNPGTSNCPVVVNIDAYDALSDSEREALDSSIDESIEHYLASYAILLEKWNNILDKKGVKRVHISDKDLTVFRKVAADPIREQWIKDMSKQGLPGQELYELVLDTLKKERV